MSRVTLIALRIGARGGWLIFGSVPLVVKPFLDFGYWEVHGLTEVVVLFLGGIWVFCQGPVKVGLLFGG